MASAVHGAAVHVGFPFHTFHPRGPRMAKPNYAFAKRQRDLAKKQRKEAKRQRKSEAAAPDVPEAAGEASDPAKKAVPTP
jgi:hypothetical protein